MRFFWGLRPPQFTATWGVWLLWKTQTQWADGCQGTKYSYNVAAGRAAGTGGMPVGTYLKVLRSLLDCPVPGTGRGWGAEAREWKGPGALPSTGSPGAPISGGSGWPQWAIRRAVLA